MFDSPYVAAALIALVTAALNWLYARTLRDGEAAHKVFFKTLMAGAVAGAVVVTSLTWFSGGASLGTLSMDRPPLEPFIAAPGMM